VRRNQLPMQKYLSLPSYVGTIFTWLLCFVLLVGCASQSPTHVSRSPTATLPVQGNNVLTLIPGSTQAIPSNFLGFSIELDQLCNILQLDAKNPAAYEQLYRNLGSSTLRIGGHTSDLSFWEPDGTAACEPDGPIVTEDLIDTFFAFAKRINWHVIWGLNLLGEEPYVAANEAAYVAAVSGDSLIGFTIGNEPDLYTKRGYRPSVWSAADFYTEWSQERDIVMTLVPSAKIIGPEACCGTGFLPSFAQAEKNDDALIALSHHFYIPHATTPSLDLLLDPAVIKQFAASAASWVSLAKANHIPFAITESNTFSDGGTPGVSNTLAAALWLNTYLLEAVSLGVSQIDLHGAENASYNAIDDKGKPTPLYYGLLLFHTMTRQARLLQSSLLTSMNLSAFATTDTSGVLRVVLINKEKATNASVIINIGQSYKTAASFQLSGPGLSATTNVTLGAKKVSSQGTWTPITTPLPSHGSTVTILVPAGSALCITFK
jgi:hypothetical protein